MNWFERYGIPGTYFYIVLLSGLYALYPCKMETIDMRALAAFAVSFLPVGYIISIIGQWLYLRDPQGGLHHRAAGQCKILSIGGRPLSELFEPDLEVFSSLNAVDAANTNNNYKEFLDKQRFIQEWIRKRMDVVVINHSIQIATLLVIPMTVLLGFALWRFGVQPKYWLILLLFVILGSVILMTCLTNRILMGQISDIITGCWTKLGFHDAAPNPGAPAEG